ncbi:MAG: 4-hydroxythreonine-4-phosphate dehydrogenase PdxA [Gammaproteobacteria bacterium]|nr:4-hydroxythreonine-4-phosphate dehydrogenase PdxA [Gammaproteobacteria bacterium]
MRPVIAITPGEPAGIGPDLAILTAEENFDCNRVYFADPELLETRARILNSKIKILSLASLDNIPEPVDNTMFVWPVKTANTVKAGKLDPENASYVLECIRLAVQSQQNKQTQALMTGPIHKGIINEAGINFSGHTEYLAELSSGTPVMMLAAEAEKLRVALVTTHLPLSQVSTAINKTNLNQVLTILNTDLKQKYGIEKPHILVCGLNPHAGENGHMGMEEIEIISPVLENLRKQGFNLTGPLPADTLFTPKYLKSADAVLAMYHDQGLPVLKHVGFGHAINITLGLSIIRTSVDHGTALDLAATSDVDTGSYIAALKTAIHLANNKAITTAI